MQHVPSGILIDFANDISLTVTTPSCFGIPSSNDGCKLYFGPGDFSRLGLILGTITGFNPFGSSGQSDGVKRTPVRLKDEPPPIVPPLSADRRDRSMRYLARIISSATAAGLM